MRVLWHYCMQLRGSMQACHSVCLLNSHDDCAQVRWLSGESGMAFWAWAVNATWHSCMVLPCHVWCIPTLCKYSNYNMYISYYVFLNQSACLMTQCAVLNNNTGPSPLLAAHELQLKHFSSLMAFRWVQQNVLKSDGTDENILKQHGIHVRVMFECSPICA